MSNLKFDYRWWDKTEEELFYLFLSKICGYKKIKMQL